MHAEIDRVDKIFIVKDSDFIIGHKQLRWIDADQWLVVVFGRGVR